MRAKACGGTSATAGQGGVAEPDAFSPLGHPHGADRGLWHGAARRRFLRGALITRELEQTDDLALLAATHDARLRDPRWVQEVSLQLARSTRAMHDRGFAHNDLKWRNLLVDPQRRLYLIDCPTGAFWHGPFLQRRIVKDLACLDKVAKYQLSRTQRLRFYLQYCQRSRLIEKDKPRIRQILNYFQGRE